MSGMLEFKAPIASRFGGNAELVVGFDLIKGTVRFVDSNVAVSGGNGLSWASAHSTLQAAHDAAKADDVIFVAPLHAENIATAGAITLSTAGLTIIGLGSRNRRPTFTWSATGSTFLISGNDITLSNIVCTCSADEVVKLFSITGKRATLDKVDYIETSGFQAIQFLLTTAAGDDLTIQNCDHKAPTAAAAAQLWIELVGSDNVRILNNIFTLVLSNSSTSTTINATGTACLGYAIAGNLICQTGGTTQDNFISMVASSIGIAADNRIGGDVGTLAASVDLASGYGSENYVATTVNKTGIPDPVAA